MGSSICLKDHLSLSAKFFFLLSANYAFVFFLLDPGINVFSVQELFSIFKLISGRPLGLVDLGLLHRQPNQSCIIIYYCSQFSYPCTFEGSQWWRHHILFHCSNDAIVYNLILSNSTTQHLLRHLLASAALFNISFASCHC